MGDRDRKGKRKLPEHKIDLSWGQRARRTRRAGGQDDDPIVDAGPVLGVPAILGETSQQRPEQEAAAGSAEEPDGGGGTLNLLSQFGRSDEVPGQCGTAADRGGGRTDGGSHSRYPLGIGRDQSTGEGLQTANADYGPLIPPTPVNFNVPLESLLDDQFGRNASASALEHGTAYQYLSDLGVEWPRQRQDAPQLQQPPPQHPRLADAPTSRSSGLQAQPTLSLATASQPAATADENLPPAGLQALLQPPQPLAPASQSAAAAANHLGGLVGQQGAVIDPPSLQAQLQLTPVLPINQPCPFCRSLPGLLKDNPLHVCNCAVCDFNGVICPTCAASQ